MGDGYSFRCKKCGYSFMANLGVGFFFPQVYRDTVNAMKQGDYGEKPKRFFEENPKGAITCDSVLVKCKDCGNYFDVPELKMFTPKPGYHPPGPKPRGSWSGPFPSEEIEYVGSEIWDNYDYYDQYEHRCPDCNGTVEFIPYEDIKNGNIICGKCGERMEMEGFIFWD